MKWILVEPDPQHSKKEQHLSRHSIFISVPVKFSFPKSGVCACSSPREESWLHLVNRKRHHLVRGRERIFDPVPVVNVKVHVHDSLEGGLEAVNGEDNVVDVAEAGGRVAFGVMPATGPVDCHTDTALH